jgi:hypothetical protein
MASRLRDLELPTAGAPPLRRRATTSFDVPTDAGNLKPNSSCNDFYPKRHRSVKPKVDISEGKRGIFKLTNPRAIFYDQVQCRIQHDRHYG